MNIYVRQFYFLTFRALANKLFHAQRVKYVWLTTDQTLTFVSVAEVRIDVVRSLQFNSYGFT